MMRINLLPYREQRRKDRRNQFYVLLVVMIAAGVAAVSLVNSVISSYVQRQQAVNNYIQQAINKLDVDIQKVNSVRKERESLLERRRVIETLQNNRGQTVRLLNEIAIRMPDAIYLTSMKQTGSVVELQGFAQANSKVSHFMKNLDESPYLSQTKLKEVKAATQGSQRLSQFSLSVELINPGEESKETGAGK